MRDRGFKGSGRRPAGVSGGPWVLVTPRGPASASPGPPVRGGRDALFSASAPAPAHGPRAPQLRAAPSAPLLKGSPAPPPRSRPGGGAPRQGVLSARVAPFRPGGAGAGPGPGSGMDHQEEGRRAPAAAGWARRSVQVHVPRPLARGVAGVGGAVGVPAVRVRVGRAVVRVAPGAGERA